MWIVSASFCTGQSIDPRWRLRPDSLVDGVTYRDLQVAAGLRKESDKQRRNFAWALARVEDQNDALRKAAKTDSASIAIHKADAKAGWAVAGERQATIIELGGKLKEARRIGVGDVLLYLSLIGGGFLIAKSVP